MVNRPRRLRKNSVIRDMTCETVLSKSDLIYPIFVVEGKNKRKAIKSMPGVFRFSVDMLDEEVAEAMAAGIKSVLLFGVPLHKDSCGSEAYNPDGVVPNAIRRLRELAPSMYIIADVCMCEYTDHGHCGIINPDGSVNNDKTLEYLSKIALTCVQAGADMVAPSNMMDGCVASIRRVLDENGYESTPIMAYSAKYASNFYGPFREAAESTPAFGDRKGYQMDYRNSDEALRETALDIEEGADVILVKPGVMCLDIIRRVKDEFNIPLAAYMVSGEYAMIKCAILQGLLNESAMFEAHIAIKRAGARMIVTYAAKEICGMID
ncbi:MAG: porphobilinogen synthase [Firmicutes bacterium HGW-Firmicutes-16]|nr:MAG: porphobilinogen synthase [Firmicutes bacterium HGW-Firmicutes-16]